MNFTFESLIEATNAIDRLRTFEARLNARKFAENESKEMQVAAAEARIKYDYALGNDLIPAEARRPSSSGARGEHGHGSGHFSPRTGTRFCAC